MTFDCVTELVTGHRTTTSTVNGSSSRCEISFFYYSTERARALLTIVFHCCWFSVRSGSHVDVVLRWSAPRSSFVLWLPLYQLKGENPLYFPNAKGKNAIGELRPIARKYGQGRSSPLIAFTCCVSLPSLGTPSTLWSFLVRSTI